MKIDLSSPVATAEFSKKERNHKDQAEINEIEMKKIIEKYLGYLGRRQWHPTPVFLPGKSHGQRSLVGCSLWGCYESDTTE